jgi:hypothetical protein
VNHRSKKKDFELLVKSVIETGNSLLEAGFVKRMMVID